MNFDHALQILRKELYELQHKNKKIFEQVVEPKDSVFSRFQPTFPLEKIDQLTGIEFKEFL